MAGMIKRNIHHLDGFVGLAGNGGGSGKDGRGEAICGALLVGTGIDRSRPPSVFCRRSRWAAAADGGAGCGLSPGPAVTTGGGECLAQ